MPSRAAPLLAVLALLVCAACGGEDAPGVRVAVRSSTEAAAPITGAEASSTAADAPVAQSRALPPAPENLFAGGPVVATYLASASVDNCLAELAVAWGLGDTGGRPCAHTDLDGDGVEDFVLAVTFPGDYPITPGDVWFFAREGEAYRLAASARQLLNSITHGVRLEAAADLTGDGLDEIVISWHACEAEPCTAGLLVASAHLGVLSDIGPRDLELAALDALEVRDASGDGLLDLTFRRTAPLDGSAGGPVRGAALTLAWGGIQFFVTERQDEAAYLLHALADADRAFAAADYTLARDRYLEALRDGSLRDWRAEAGQPPGRPELVAYGLVRAGLAAIRLGDDVGGLGLLRQAAESRATTVIGLAADTYVLSVDAGIPHGEACGFVETVLNSRAADWVAIWDYGPANPAHAIDDLCR